MNIEGLDIGPDSPCRFVCEVSNAHNGDLARALRLVEAAKEAGASFVKFQCFVPSELVALRGDGPAPDPWGAQGWTMRALYEKARTPLDWFPELFRYAREIGIVPFASVFGPESLATLLAVDCPALKIARLDRGNQGLFLSAFATGRPVLVSSECLTLRPSDRLAQLYCPPGYPTPRSEVHLPMFAPDGFLGLSSHCLAPMLPVAAVARGCALIEMHLQLEAELSELERDVSLTERQFAAMIAKVRQTEALLA